MSQQAERADLLRAIEKNAIAMELIVRDTLLLARQLQAMPTNEIVREFKLLQFPVRKEQC